MRAPRDREIVEDYYDEKEHGTQTLNPHVHEIRDANFLPTYKKSSQP